LECGRCRGRHDRLPEELKEQNIQVINYLNNVNYFIVNSFK
jgi:transcription antitermination factor NusA-like protein